MSNLFGITGTQQPSYTSSCSILAATACSFLDSDSQLRLDIACDHQGQPCTATRSLLLARHYTYSYLKGKYLIAFHNTLASKNYMHFSIYKDNLSQTIFLSFRS